MYRQREKIFASEIGKGNLEMCVSVTVEDLSGYNIVAEVENPCRGSK